MPGLTRDVAGEHFTDVSHTDVHGDTRSWAAADTRVGLPIGTTGEVFPMRQISRIVPTRGGGSRQIHILTTDTGMSAGEVIYRMGARWRQENYFRYARIRFDLDSHEAYASTEDDPERSVPNPAKRLAYQQGSSPPKPATARSWPIPTQRCSRPGHRRRERPRS
jgi:hypothetical protein